MESPNDLDEADNMDFPFATFAMPNGVTIEHGIIETPSVSSLVEYDYLSTAATFGGLLTEPRLQSNCCRLEAMTHLAVALANGRKRVGRAIVTRWFNSLGPGSFGRLEDPAEDVFVSVVTSKLGNFRILEGTWESSSFYLQRIVNIVEGMPSDGDWKSLRESVYALLRLSELICERAAISRYASGARYPVDRFPDELAEKLAEYRCRVVFSDAELRREGLSPSAFDPFILEAGLSKSVLAGCLSHSPLIDPPLLRGNRRLVVALPTAISAAIRSFVIGYVTYMGLNDTLLKALAHEYGEYFSKNPVLGGRREVPIHFNWKQQVVTASYAYQVDAGRYFHVVLALDTLNDFEETGIGGIAPDRFSLGAHVDCDITECHRAMSEDKDFRGGLTLVVNCGVGRSAVHIASERERSDWKVAFLSAADTATLGLLNHVDPLTIWRIIGAQERLRTQRVRIFNINGLLNLIAWARALNGHLVHHGKLPEELVLGQGFSLVVPTNAVLDLRLEVAENLDRHALIDPNGKWIPVRKVGDSFFDEDRALPFYVAERFDLRHSVNIVIKQSRTWWCVVAPRSYDRWKILATWLPKIAEVVDAELHLTAPVSLEVNFAASDVKMSNSDPPTMNDISERMRISLDESTNAIKVETEEFFERGLSLPQNVSEAALVFTIVSAALKLAGRFSTQRATHLYKMIVNNESARSLHCFTAIRFRDFVHEDLQGQLITIDPIDDASSRLGLGWRIRDRREGGEIEGKTQCTSFLNELVKTVEDDLCLDLRFFDRQKLVELALRNHECAMVNQSTWRRTSGAVLALHDDKGAAMATIAQQEFKNNAALHASRVLVELAICECPQQAGVISGAMDLSRLMAKLLLAVTYGGWSDSIHRDAMKPALKITPLGDIHADNAFFDNVVEPFGHMSSSKMVDSAIEAYSDNFNVANAVSEVEPAFESEFCDAWRDERTFGLDDYRRLVDELEDMGERQGKAVITLRRSELEALIAEKVPHGREIGRLLTLLPRQQWRNVPLGYEKDLQPWRFRRRLSLLRLPLVQIDESDDPLLVIAPGLVRDALTNTVRCYYEGDVPKDHINSASMRSWRGKRADVRGTKFSRDVAARMNLHGWKTETDVAVTKILRMGFDRNFGDVDCLAWNEQTARVLLIECKDILRATAGAL